MGERSGPTQGHGVPSGHQPGRPERHSEAGSVLESFPGIQTVVPLTGSKFPCRWMVLADGPEALPSQ